MEVLSGSLLVVHFMAHFVSDLASLPSFSFLPRPPLFLPRPPLLQRINRTELQVSLPAVSTSYRSTHSSFFFQLFCYNPLSSTAFFYFFNPLRDVLWEPCGDNYIRDAACRLPWSLFNPLPSSRPSFLLVHGLVNGHF